MRIRGIFCTFAPAKRGKTAASYETSLCDYEDETGHTIREALRYKDSAGNAATAYLVFNITFQAATTARCHLASIAYNMPDGITTPQAMPSKPHGPGICYNLNGQRIGNKDIRNKDIGNKDIENKESGKNTQPTGSPCRVYILNGQKYLLQ